MADDDIPKPEQSGITREMQRVEWSVKPDPTVNVQAIVAATAERLDGLRLAESRRIDEMIKAESRRIDELRLSESKYQDIVSTIRAMHATELREAEAKRIDAIRAVDVGAVGVANERATLTATVLANQVSASAETLRALVASTAATQAAQLAQFTSQISDRVSAVEKAQYENKGSGSGMRDMWGWVVAAIAFITTLGFGLFSALKP